MKKLLIFLIVFTSQARGDIELVNFTLQFGASQLDVDGETTRGFGLSATTELYQSLTHGWTVTYGNATTTADDIEINDKDASDVSITNKYLRLGPFYSPYPGLTIGAGGSFHRINQDIDYTDNTDEDTSTNYGGPYFNLGYILPIDYYILGAQFSYVSFGQYSQSDLFLNFGYRF